MAFRPGDHVHVAALGKGIIREVRNSGRYAVEVKGHTMVVDESKLTTAQHDRRRRSKDAVAAAPVAVPESLTRAHASSTLDLHGKTVEEAVTALDSFLNDAILAGLADVRVIHGRSGGRLKAAVHSRLKMLTSVRAFRVDASNPGVTIVSV